MSQECTFKSRFHIGQTVVVTTWPANDNRGKVMSVTFDHTGRITYGVHKLGEKNGPFDVIENVDTIHLSDASISREVSAQRIEAKRQSRDRQRAKGSHPYTRRQDVKP